MPCTRSSSVSDEPDTPDGNVSASQSTDLWSISAIYILQSIHPTQNWDFYLMPSINVIIMHWLDKGTLSWCLVLIGIVYIGMHLQIVSLVLCDLLQSGEADQILYFDMWCPVFSAVWYCLYWHIYYPLQSEAPLTFNLRLLTCSKFSSTWYLLLRAFGVALFWHSLMLHSFYDIAWYCS